MSVESPGKSDTYLSMSPRLMIHDVELFGIYKKSLPTSSGVIFRGIILVRCFFNYGSITNIRNI